MSAGSRIADHMERARELAIESANRPAVLAGIADEYGTIWKGEPGASERIGDLLPGSDEETYEVRLIVDVAVLARAEEVAAALEAEGLPADTPLAGLIEHHRNNAACAAMLTSSRTRS